MYKEYLYDTPYFLRRIVMTRIIIAGGRDFLDYLKMYIEMNTIIQTIHDDIEIISGCAKGADTLGMRYAAVTKIPCAKFPADWDKFGNRAGFIRNEEMAKYSISDNSKGVLVAFWDGKSKGTANMIKLAEKYGLETHVIRY